MNRRRVVITGTGAVCAAGRDPASILEAIRAGRSAIAPIRQWDAAQWPMQAAGEIPDLKPRDMVEDRKLHKLIRRTDLFGLYAADRAIEASGLATYRATLGDAAAAYSDRTGVYVGSGGGNYESQYDYFPLLTAAQEKLPAFGQELSSNVNPMWLLRTLPNNVLGHIGIRHGFKGANACITNHSIGGTLAVIEAMEALRTGEADRALAVGHDAPIEPQMVLYYHDVGLLAKDTIRPFDARRDGSLFGEGAAALALETEESARSRDAPILGEVLGGGAATDAQGLLAIREDGDALCRSRDDRRARQRHTAVGCLRGRRDPSRLRSECAAGYGVQMGVRASDCGSRNHRVGARTGELASAHRAGDRHLCRSRSCLRRGARRRRTPIAARRRCAGPLPRFRRHQRGAPAARRELKEPAAAWAEPSQ